MARTAIFHSFTNGQKGDALFRRTLPLRAGKQSFADQR